MPITKADLVEGTVFKYNGVDEEYIVLSDDVIKDIASINAKESVPAALNDGRFHYDYLFSVADFNSAEDGYVIVTPEPVNETPQIDTQAILIEALREIILADIHVDGDDIDNHVAGQPHSSRAWVGPYGLIAQRALKKIKNV